MYYTTRKSISELIIWINNSWTWFWVEANANNELPETQLRQYIIDSLHYDKHVYRMNYDSKLTKYISNAPNFLAIDQPNVEKMIYGFKKLSIRFIAIDHTVSNKDLFDAVYQNDMYMLNFNNITLMMQTQYDNVSMNDIIHSNYTMILTVPESPLAKYISKNKQAYMELVVNNCDGEICDDEMVSLKTLNDEEIDTQTKILYIDVLTTTITSLEQISNKDLWETLLKNNRVSISLNNCITYYTELGLDETLIDYLNDQCVDLDFAYVKEICDQTTAAKFFDDVSTCNALHTDLYRKILVDMDYFFDQYHCSEIADDKLQVLIKYHIIIMNEDGLKFVRKNYPDHLIAFIKTNTNEYLSLMETQLFELEEALEILTWELDDEKKIALISLTSQRISIVDKVYSDRVASYVLTHNFDSSDKAALYKKYSEYGSQTKERIYSLAKTGYREIISNNFPLDDALRSLLLKDEDIPRDSKISLFILSIPRLTEETCSKHFAELGLEELQYIFKRANRKKYEISSEVERVFNALKQHGWIYDYKKDDSSPQKYTVTKNKPPKNKLIPSS